MKPPIIIDADRTPDDESRHLQEDSARIQAEIELSNQMLLDKATEDFEEAMEQIKAYRLF